jgi:Txe/YoeB family toxin of Txe-Axe toxin-antitoxin module
MKLLTWHTSSWEDYLYWQENDKEIVEKINGLI